MRDREEIDFCFIYAYQLRACVNGAHRAYKIGPGYERRTGNLFNFSSQSQKPKPLPSESKIKFEIARANENEDAEGVFWDFIAKFSDYEETFQGVLLKYPLPMSHYVAAAVGLGMYAWLIAYLLI